MSLFLPRAAAKVNYEDRTMDITRSALLTDLYQLAMTQVYIEHGKTGTAVFEFFARKLPPSRGFLIAAGLEQALDFLEDFRFSSEDIEWLAKTRRFDSNLLNYLSDMRFTGDVHAIAEGTIFFPDEPILRVTHPAGRANGQVTADQYPAFSNPHRLESGSPHPVGSR